jgi:hypothetical protein
MAGYDAWVRERDPRAASDGPSGVAPAPMAKRVADLFGGWRRALRAVFGDDVVLSRRTRPDDYTREELLVMWRACRRELSHAPSARIMTGGGSPSAALLTARAARLTAIRLPGGWAAVGGAPSPRLRERYYRGRADRGRSVPASCSRHASRYCAYSRLMVHDRPPQRNAPARQRARTS